MRLKHFVLSLSCGIKYKTYLPYSWYGEGQDGIIATVASHRVTGVGRRSVQRVNPANTLQ